MDFEDTLWTVLGAGLVLLMLVDVFRTLLYPHGSGPLGRAIMRGFWLVSRKLRGRGSFIAAPLAMAAVIGAWAGLAAIGWALLYLPHLTDGFVYGAGVPLRADFAEALYISMVTLSTVGFGDIVAAHPLLRLVVALQAVTGFGLLTATVTWILQTFPALEPPPGPCPPAEPVQGGCRSGRSYWPWIPVTLPDCWRQLPETWLR